MKYSGTILGFQSSFGSIYNIIIDDSKCYAWKANVIGELNGKVLNIRFNWNGDSYEMILSLLKENYYTGKIIWNKEPVGTAFFYSYLKEDSILLKGDFKEDDTGNYECFIELKFVQA